MLVNFSLYWKSKLYLALSVLLYVLLLNFAYVNLLNVFTWDSFLAPPLYQWGVAVILSIIPAFFLRPLYYQISNFVVFFLYILIYIPACFVPLFLGRLLWINYLENISTLLVCLFLLNSLLYLRCFSIKQHTFPVKKLWNIFLLLIVVWFIFFIFSFKELASFVSFKDVYVRRLIFSKKMTGNYFFAYSAQWLQSVILPLLIIYGLNYKRLICIFLGIIGLLILYMVTANKIDLFAIMVLIGGYFFFIYLSKKSYLQRSELLMLFLNIFLIGLIYIDVIFGNTNLIDWFLRRPIIDSGLMIAWHWIYFAHHPYGYWRCSALAFLQHCPYPVDLNYQVGYYFSGRIQQNADVNFWGSAYSNMGNFGVLVYTLLLAILLIIFDALTRQAKRNFSVLLAVWLAYLLIQADFFTMLSSHGVAILLILCYIFRPLLDEHKDKHSFLR